LKTQKEEEKKYSKFDVRETSNRKVGTNLRDSLAKKAPLQAVKKSSIDGPQRKLIQQTLGTSAKESDCQKILSEYHRCLQEATEKYPTKNINLRYLTFLAKESRRDLDNEFSVLPPEHQKIIHQMLN
jgi:hypothetical protein